MLKKGKLLPLIFSGVTAATVSLATVSCSFEHNPLTIEGPSEFMVETGGELEPETDYEPYKVELYEAQVVSGTTLTIEPINHIGDEIWDNIAINEKGYLYTKEPFTDVEPCTLSFKVHAEYKDEKENKNYECDSDVVSLAIVEPSSKKITVEGGSPSIEMKKPFADYTDASPWELKVEGEAVDATFELDGGSDPEVGEGQHINIQKDTGDNKWYVHVDGDTTPGAHTFQVIGTGTEGNADLTASANVTVVVNDADVYKVMGGSTTLNGTYGTAGADTGNAWALYKNGVKQDMTGASYELISDDEDVTTGEIIIESGVVSWSASVSSGIFKVHTFDVQITTTTGEVYSTGTSGAVTLTIADLYRFTPAAGVEFGKEGQSGQSGTFFFDANMTSGEVAYTVGFDGPAPTFDVQVVSTEGTSHNKYFKWNQDPNVTDVPVGDHELNFAAKVNNVTVAKCTVHLIISDADTYTTIGGSTSLTGVFGSEGQDTEMWQLLVNGVPYTSRLIYQITNGSGEPITISGLYVDSFDNGRGRVRWNNSIAQETHTFYVSAFTNEATPVLIDTSDQITLTIEEPEEEPIIIEGPSVVKATDPSAVFKAYNFPKAEDADPIEGLHWTVEGWTGDTAYRPTMVTTEDEEGNEVVRLSTVASAVGTATIQATDEASNVVAKFEATVQDPTLDSNEVWTVIVDDFGSRWATLSMDDLTSTSDSIHYKFIGTTSGDDGSIGRGVFNQEIKIGNYVDYIPDNFLNNCAAFGTNGTGKVTFVDEEDNPASCTRIGEYFMENCQNFNSPLALPSTIKRIDDGFMADCIKFNNGQTTAISNFYMPASLTHIGDEFLYDCRAFNQNLAIANTVTYVGNEFMQNCDAMVATITINASIDAFEAPTTSLSFASDTYQAACVTGGIKIDGPSAASIISAFPRLIQTAEGDNGRYLIPAS